MMELLSPFFLAQLRLIGALSSISAAQPGASSGQSATFLPPNVYLPGTKPVSGVVLR